MGWGGIAFSRGIIGPMAAEPTEIRMPRLEGAYEQINERLGVLEQRLVAEIGSVRGEVVALRSDVHSDQAELRRQITNQFYWLLTLILGSILIPLLRDLVR
ncbi:MAG TPA: hypothetical protein VGR24_13120 [bacterium]|jgi:hypothetical protein|nr:hypothetical protein [bacterium]